MKKHNITYVKIAIVTSGMVAVVLWLSYLYLPWPFGYRGALKPSEIEKVLKTQPQTIDELYARLQKYTTDDYSDYLNEEQTEYDMKVQARHTLSVKVSMLNSDSYRYAWYNDNYTIRDIHHVDDLSSSSPGLIYGTMSARSGTTYHILLNEKKEIIGWAIREMPY